MTSAWLADLQILPTMMIQVSAQRAAPAPLVSTHAIAGLAGRRAPAGACIQRADRMLLPAARSDCCSGIIRPEFVGCCLACCGQQDDASVRVGSGS